MNSLENKYRQNTYQYILSKERKFFIIFFSLILLMFLSVILSVSLGAVHISPNEIYRIVVAKLGFIDNSGVEVYKEKLFLSIRLPRICLGIIAGFALAVAGAVLQGLFKNPLSDPSLIGTSSGAAASVVLFIILGHQITVLKLLQNFMGIFALPVFAFIGAVSVTFLTYTLSKTGHKTVISTMLLIGIAINSLVGAVTGLAMYYADDSQLRSITFWSLGSLGGTNWKEVTAITSIIFICLIFIFRLSKEMNSFLLGESVALHVGTDVEKVKKRMIILTSLITGAIVSVSGIIGFIGLITPHLSRLIVGSNYKYLLPTSCVMGAIIIIISDLISRVIISPAELPIGIITSLLGAPFFLWLILNDKKKQIN